MEKTLPFEREKHLYKRDDFEEICKDAMRFFSGTPAVVFPPPESFKGAGLYALYYIGKTGLYQRFGLEINRTEYAVPIYVGKAEPSGWRQSRDLSVEADGTKLYPRLVQHSRTIASAKNLKVSDFVCRLMIFEGPIKGMIASVEAALIAKHRPLWHNRRLWQPQPRCGQSQRQGFPMGCASSWARMGEKHRGGNAGRETRRP